MLKVNSSQSNESILSDIKNSFSFADVHIELISESANTDEKKIKISSQISYQNLDYLNSFIEKIKQLVQVKNFTIESFHTEQPNLEEVFLKINSGNIPSHTANNSN